MSPVAVRPIAVPGVKPSTPTQVIQPRVVAPSQPVGVVPAKPIHPAAPQQRASPAYQPQKTQATPEQQAPVVDQAEIAETDHFYMGSIVNEVKQ